MGEIVAGPCPFFGSLGSPCNLRRLHRHAPIARHRRDAVYPQHDRLGVTGGIAEPVRAAACEAEAVAVLERPAFGTDGELHFALDHESVFLAFMRIELVPGASAGLHVDQKQVETAFRSGRAETD
jgi:hypothetical protein